MNAIRFFDWGLNNKRVRWIEEGCSSKEQIFGTTLIERTFYYGKGDCWKYKISAPYSNNYHFDGNIGEIDELVPSFSFSCFLSLSNVNAKVIDLRHCIEATYITIENLGNRIEKIIVPEKFGKKILTQKAITGGRIIFQQKTAADIFPVILCSNSELDNILSKIVSG